MNNEAISNNYMNSCGMNSCNMCDIGCNSGCSCNSGTQGNSCFWIIWIIIIIILISCFCGNN